MAPRWDGAVGAIRPWQALRPLVATLQIVERGSQSAEEPVYILFRIVAVDGRSQTAGMAHDVDVLPAKLLVDSLGRGMPEGNDPGQVVRLARRENLDRHSAQLREAAKDKRPNG